MNAMSWMKWFCIGLLAVGCTLTTGCSGDDEETTLNTTTTVVTNTVGGVTTVITNAVVVTNAPAEDPAVPVISTLLAPHLISPENGAVIDTGLARLKIEFEWTAVRGADSYILELDGVPHPTQGAVTQMTLSVTKDTNPHPWRVRAKKASSGELGPESETFTFWFAF